MLGEKKNAKPVTPTGPPDEWEIIEIAETFHVLPTTVERELDEFWLNQVRAVMTGKAQNEWRRDKEK